MKIQEISIETVIIRNFQRSFLSKPSKSSKEERAELACKKQIPEKFLQMRMEGGRQYKHEHRLTDGQRIPTRIQSTWKFKSKKELKTIPLPDWIQTQETALKVVICWVSQPPLPKRQSGPYDPPFLPFFKKKVYRGLINFCLVYMSLNGFIEVH